MLSWLSWPSMLSLLLVFPLLTLIVSTDYFFCPFIVSNGALLYIYIITADSCLAEVSRLILNLLEANCFLEQSINSMTMESIIFRQSESNRDTEADISRDDRGVTSLSTEIYEGERWWIDHSALFMPDVDDMITNCFCSFCTTLLASYDELGKTIHTNKIGR